MKLAIWLALAFSPSLLIGQQFDDTKVFDDKAAAGDEERKSGQKVSVAAGGNIVDNKNVVGQSDGKTSIYTLDASYQNDKINKGSEWISNVSLIESVSKTPTNDRFVKTDDEFKADTTYKSFFSGMDWLGTFARLDLSTPLMDGYDDQGGGVYTVTYLDKAPETVTEERFKLNDGFKPLVTKESLGAVAKFLDKKAANGEFRLGLGGKQIQSKGQFIVEDDEETAEIEVRELDDVSLLGLQAVVEIDGVTLSDTFDYKMFAEALYPMQYSPKNDGDPDEKDLVSTEFGVKLAYKLSSWFSANYKFSSKRDPLLTDKAQVTHNFIFAANYVWDTRK